MTYHSLQEVFNVAVAGLASQGFERSMTDARNYSCAYRGNGDRRCAIGWCIPDDLYDPETEGIRPLVARFRRVYGALFHGVDFSELTVLQEAHDMAADAADMRARLREFAKLYKLALPAVLAEEATP